MGRIVQKLSIIILITLVLSVGIDSLYRHAYRLPYKWPQNIWILPPIKDKYEIVKLGNSHADEGITFDRYKLKSIAITGVAQSFEYDLANLKMHSRQIKEGAIIIINVSPISFSQGIAKREDSLQTVYYDGRLSPFLIPNLKVEDYLQSQFFPFLRAGFLWRQKINEQIRVRIAAEEKWPDTSPTPTPVLVRDTVTAPITMGEGMAAYTQHGNYFNVNDIRYELIYHSAAPANKLEESTNFIFKKWYRTDGFGTEYFDANRKDLEDMIAYCLKMKWRPVLITIPISKVLQVGLLPDYMQVYVYNNVAKANLHGAEYFDFTKDERFTKDSFLYSDSDHFNNNGAAVFSYILLRKLIDQGYLPSAVDGYDYSSIP